MVIGKDSYLRFADQELSEFWILWRFIHQGFILQQRRKEKQANGDTMFYSAAPLSSTLNKQKLIFWTSHKHSIYILCPASRMI